MKIDESQIWIKNLIGKGTFGEVFEGILKMDDQTELSIAIKVSP